MKYFKMLIHLTCISCSNDGYQNENYYNPSHFDFLGELFELKLCHKKRKDKYVGQQ